MSFCFGSRVRSSEYTTFYTKMQPLFIYKHLLAIIGSTPSSSPAANVRQMLQCCLAHFSVAAVFAFRSSNTSASSPLPFTLSRM